MFALKMLLVAAFIGSIIWTFVDPGYEPVTAVIITGGSLLAIRVNQRAQKDKRTFEPKNPHD